MPKWKTDPDAQLAKLHKLHAAIVRRVASLPPDLSNLAEAEKKIIRQISPREQWLWDQLSQYARAHGIEFGESNQSEKEVVALTVVETVYRRCPNAPEFRASVDTMKPARYLPPGMTNEGLLAAWFLETGIRLKIPKSKMPKCKVEIPDVTLQVAADPPFDVRTGSHSDYRLKAEKSYSKLPLKEINRQIQSFVRLGMLVPQKQRRESGKVAPLELRLEWAALHHCQQRSYPWLHRKHNPGRRYTLGQIRRATQRLLMELGKLFTLGETLGTPKEKVG